MMKRSPSERDLTSELCRLIGLELSQFFTLSEINYIIKSTDGDLDESTHLLQHTYIINRKSTRDISEDIIIAQLERLVQQAAWI